MAHIFMDLMHKITEETENIQELCFIGINEKGYVLAKRMADFFVTRENLVVPVYPLCACAAAEKNSVLLVTDVLAGGEEACRAVYTVLTMHSFSKIFLATLIFAYNQKKLPIMPDFAGKRMFVPQRDKITVGFWELGEEEGVYAIK